MRTALLPTNGDPFIVAYWLRNFATWRDEVDELVVFANAYQFADLPFIRREVEAVGGRFYHANMPLGHGDAIGLLLTMTEADLVVLCEEDAFVRRPGAVRAAFDLIEDGYTDIVGSPRGEEHVTVDWGPYDPTDTAEIAHNLWPCFLFARRADLRQTSQRFGDLQWNLGNYVEGFGPVTAEHCTLVGVGPDRIHLDTFAGTTFELRAKGLRVELVHHVRLYDLTRSRERLADPPPWFHVTGSSEIGHVLDGTPPEQLPDYGKGGGQWVRRLAWWDRVLDIVEDAPNRDAYRWRFDGFKGEAQIDPAEYIAWAYLFSDYDRQAVAA